MATKLDIALEECLEQLRTGEATVEQCLQRYPELQAQLQPMLQAATQLQELGEFKPRPEFRMQARAMLHGYMRASPRRRPTFSVNLMRLATSLGVVVLALLSTGAALAQSALPGDPLYSVKLTTEQVWRNLQSDPLRADATLADRRMQELAAVQGQPELEEISIALYTETVQQLRSAASDDPQMTAWLNQVLVSQHNTLEELLAKSTLELPEKLFDLLLQPLNGVNPNGVAPATTPTPEGSLNSPTQKPTQAASATPDLVREIVPTLLPVFSEPKQDSQDNAKEDTPAPLGVLPILGDAVDTTLDVIKGLFGDK